MHQPWNWTRCLIALAVLGPLVVGVLVVVGNLGQAGADESRAPAPAADDREPTPDEKAVQRVAAAYTKAFNAGDAKAVAALWTEDGELVDAEGQIFRGRDAIAKEFANYFAGQPGATVELRSDSLRVISPDAAVANGTARVQPAAGHVQLGQYTAVYVKKDGQWLLAEVKESKATPTSNYEYLRELEWLMGTWAGQNDEISVELTYAWTANRNFIHRTYTVKKGGRVTHTGHEMIGWDPTQGQVRSWLFNSEGGFGADFWTRDGNHWAIEAKGVHRDGSQTEAINILTHVDANTYTWQSTHRVVDGVSVPDLGEIKMVRTKAKQ